MEITKELIEKGEITLYRGDVDSIRVIEAHNMHMSECQVKMKPVKQVKWALVVWNLFMGFVLVLFILMSFEVKAVIPIVIIVDVILLGMWYRFEYPLKSEPYYPDFKRICITYDDFNPRNKDYSKMLYGEITSESQQV
ncbi:MAG: hypothetical protein J6K37_00995 [Lachnospiraceae bacterium]|nr:hypothetical protein [Lachnospiraceae bacterium]